MQNPLLNYADFLDFTAIKPEHIVPAIDKILADNRSQIQHILQQNSDYTWHNLSQPLDDINDRLTFIWNAISHLHGVVNSPELRQAYELCLPKMTAYGTEISHNKQLFEAIHYLHQNGHQQKLNTVQQKILKDEIRDFHLSGVALSDQDKERFATLNQELSELSNRFEQNLLDATQLWQKHIIDATELAGLPERVQEGLKATAAQKKLEGWLITLDQPTYIAIMTHADSRALRQEVYTAYATRASDQGPNAGKYDNTPVMQAILQKRHALAELLGFKNFAELSITTKTAKTTDEVINFLKDLLERALPVAKREFSELQDFAKTQYHLDSVEAWDIAYLSEKLQEQRFNITEEELRPYFPIDQVLSGLFAVVSRLFNIHIEEATGIPVWHPEVRFFNLYNHNQEIIGHFYLDIYARDNKRSGAWMEQARSHRRLNNGKTQIPIAYITCNFAKAVGNQPALLTHDEVETLFHEFGHGLHLLLTEVEYLSASGINGVPWDVVELPSQFLENWCWEQAALDLLASHYQTHQPLPIDKIEKLRARKYFQSGMQTIRQLEFSLYDFRLHLEYDPQRNDQWLTVLNEIRQQSALYPVPSFNRFPNSFAHIFAGGYAAGYYSYKWAEVWSADAYGKFEENGIFDQTTGKSFRQNILAKGSSSDAMELFINFRGRAPQVDALVKQLERSSV